MNQDFRIVSNVMSETEGIISESMEAVSMTIRDYDKAEGSIQTLLDVNAQGEEHLPDARSFAFKCNFLKKNTTNNCSVFVTEGRQRGRVC